MWKDRRVFVTGATGLVGSWLIKQLLELGTHVVVLVRDWDPQTELIRSGDMTRTTVVNGGLEDFGVLQRAINDHGTDTIFHLGAQALVGPAYRSPLPTFESNIRGTYNLLEASRLFPTVVRRMVVASSDKAYGHVAELPYTEDMPANGRHPYDVSKSCMDLLAMTYATSYGLPVTIARCGNIYGGADLNWSRIVPGTIRSLGEEQNPLIRSDGKMTRDYIYVKDVVSAYLTLAEKAAEPGITGEAFNFSVGKPRSVLEVTEILQRLMGRPDLEPIILNEAKAEIYDQYLDSTKAQIVLNWQPTYTFEEGLEETITWYEEFLTAGGVLRGNKGVTPTLKGVTFENDTV